MLPTLSSLAADLASGRTTSRRLVDDCLAKIEAADGEGSRAFLKVDAGAARATADAFDMLRAANANVGPYAGIPVSIKDLFDIQGEVTRAGSKVLNDAVPATSDAHAVAQLRRAGFVLIGRTNMTEFAYSGLGLNPHYGTPRNVWDRKVGRIPGGSSSGAAISVTDGMAHGALGTDTGGSCRIPAAFNGLTGFKPSAYRVKQTGSIPLAPSLDSIGPIARSVACCAALDNILSGEDSRPFERRDCAGLRFLVPTTIALDGLDDKVSADFRALLSVLAVRGAQIIEAHFPEFSEIGPLNSTGGFTASESYAWHRNLLERSGKDYDPRVRSRIARGADQRAVDYIQLREARASLVRRSSARLDDFDALLMPTVPIVAPRLSDVEDDQAFTDVNLLVLRNSTLINMIDGCAISLPIHKRDTAPVGLTIAGARGSDRQILSIAAGIEKVFLSE